MPRQKTPPKPEPLVGVWLLVVCAFVAGMVIVGGATRLTDSGLSITEWNFAKQVVPPMSEAAWREEFRLYQGTTEFAAQNHAMTMAEFRYIYLWEWAHRFLGKVVGLVFALPFLAFLLAGKLQGRLWPVVVLFTLGGLQGYVGWWMVQSGLVGRVDVAPYRLATHLGLAFVIFALSLRLALAAFGWPGAKAPAPGLRPIAWAFAGVLFVQILAGAVVAGLDAGRAFTDWPTIGGDVVPWRFWQGVASLGEAVENHALAQFVHRSLGYVLALAALAIGALCWRLTPGPARTLGLALAGVALCQTALGITAVVNAAPLGLSLAHQALALCLWAVAHAFVATVDRPAARA